MLFVGYHEVMRQVARQMGGQYFQGDIIQYFLFRRHLLKGMGGQHSLIGITLVSVNQTHFLVGEKNKAHNL